MHLYNKKTDASIQVAGSNDKPLTSQHRSPGSGLVLRNIINQLINLYIFERERVRDRQREREKERDSVYEREIV